MPTDCSMPCCSRPALRAMPICRAHHKALPEDLRDRLRWAWREGDREDREAAMHAACDYLAE